MSVFVCPYCSITMPVTENTHITYFPSYERQSSLHHGLPSDESSLKVDFYRCPECHKYIITAEGAGEAVKNVKVNILPSSLSKHFPDYVPLAIRQDYIEAYSIVNLSPKASATLARRCLQGIIRDFWNIKEKNLNAEITKLKDYIQPDLWAPIDALRQIGNIGAHMEKEVNTIIDIDPNEAEMLLKLIELLIKEWYINREERKKLFNSITSANETIQGKRKI